MAAAPARVGRMNYENFKDIAARVRVIPMNWPVSFKPPARLAVLELHALHTVLYSGNPPVLFRKLTNAEWALPEQAILDGTSPYLVPPFLHNALPMPGPLQLTGLATPASDEALPPSDPTATPSSDPAQPAHTEDNDPSLPPSPSSLPSQLAQNLQVPDVSLPPVPGPRGGAIISFGEKPKKTPAKRKKKQTAVEREAAKKAKAIEKEAAKAAKEAAKAAKEAEKQAKAASKKKSAGKKKAAGQAGKKSGKKAQSQKVSETAVSA